MVQPVPTQGSNGSAHRAQIAAALNQLIKQLQGTDEPDIAALKIDVATLQTDVAAISPWTTGDIKVTLKTTADTGWVLFDDGTIGDASSSATTRANADTEDLFTLLWTNTADADCAVSSGRGATAAADFAAHKTIALPKVLGRALAVAGAGSGLTSRALASVIGAETHTLTTAEMPSHAHEISGGTYTSGVPGIQGQNLTAVQRDNTDGLAKTSDTGSGDAHSIMSPRIHFNIMVKL